MSDKKYWSSFAELNNKEKLQKLRADEFGEDLPFEDLDGKGLLDAKTPRRDFLKYLGFSTAAATLAASCKQPVRKAIPFTNRPENIVPGVAKYYASTYVQDGDVVPVIVKVRDGRPIKIEGNEKYRFTQGGTSPRAHARPQAPPLLTSGLTAARLSPSSPARGGRSAGTTAGASPRA